RISSIRHKLRWALILRNAAGCAFSIVDAVIPALAERKLRDRALGMISHVANIFGKKRLVFLMDVSRHIRPPEKRLRVHRAVVKPYAQLDVRSSGLQTHAMHSFEPQERIVIAAPGGNGTIILAFNRDLNRHERRRPMMLRPIEFNAP